MDPAWPHRCPGPRATVRATDGIRVALICETALRVTLSNCGFTAQRMQNRRVVPGVSVCMRMLNRIGAFKRGTQLCDSPVDETQNPEHPRHEGQHGDSSVLAGCPSGHLVDLLTDAEYLDGALDRLAGFDDASQEKENHCPSAGRIDQRRPIIARFGSAQ